jgi:hypothetical protein
MEQNRNRNEGQPNRQSSMEQAEGSRETARESESVRNRGSARAGSQGEDLGTSSDRAMMIDRESEERDSADVSRSSGRASSSTSGEPGGRSGGISNRGRDREVSEQQQLPERGRSQSER